MLEVTSRRRQLAALSDGGLLRELSRLDLVDRRTQVEILLHLAEIDRRKLHGGLKLDNAPASGAARALRAARSFCTTGRGDPGRSAGRGEG